MKKIKILITGAGGYIGAIGTNLFLEEGFEVVAVDNFSAGFKKPLTMLQKKFGKDNLRIYQESLQNNLAHIFKKERSIVAIIHYAASCQIDESMRNPIKYFDNNVVATQNILKYAIDFKVTNFIFSSTCAVYGETSYSPVNESCSLNPNNPYGESKRIAEKIIEWYSKIYHLKYINLRYFNVCGATDDGAIGDSKTPSPLLISNLVRTSLGLQQFKLTFPKVKTQDTSPIRDYVNVIDINVAHLKALRYLLSGGNSHTLNLGTSKGFSVLEIIAKVKQVTGADFVVVKNTTKRLGESAIAIADYTKAEKILGWKPERSLEDSILSLYKWFSSHPYGWNRDIPKLQSNQHKELTFASQSPKANKFEE